MLDNKEIVGDKFEDQSELLQASLAVLVSGAGSLEVNGCYLLKGRYGNAWEFELDNTATGRIFEIFKVDEESGWWNIQERVENSHPNPVHYGVEGESDAILPPTSGWGSVEYSDSWLGTYPMPIIEVAANRKACLASTQSQLLSQRVSDGSLDPGLVQMIHPQAQEARIDFVVDIDQDYLANLKFELPTIVNSTNSQDGVKVNDFVIDIVSIGSDTRIDYVSRVYPNFLVHIF